MIEKHQVDFSNLPETEWQYLKVLKSGFINNVSAKEMKSIMQSREAKSRHSIINSIEYDIKGFYEMGQTMETSIVLVEKFRNKTRAQIFELLLDRLNSIKDGLSEIPERLFYLLPIRIQFRDRLIDVIIVQQKPHDYILFKSPYYEEEYFIRFSYDWHSSGPEIVMLQNVDSKKIKLMAEDEIDSMIKAYKFRS